MEAMEEARLLADVPLERRRSSRCNDDDSYYYWNKKSDEEDEGPRRRRESMVNKLISTVYSGPTISDIESALSFTGGDQLLTMDNSSATSSIPSAPVVVFSPEKVLSKMENKYTLKIKTSSGNGGGLAEDGYKWRKYGQKSIKNSPNPRSYYRCTNPRCNAKKQVERATDEADTLLVTYEGLHLHYTYSPQHLLSSSKKPKLQQYSRPPAHDEMSSPQVLDAAHHPGGGGGLEQQQQDQACCFVDEQQLLMTTNYCTSYSTNNNHDGGGLLEDVVPLLVRRPCTNNSSTSPSSVYNTIDNMAILSNIF